LGVLKALINRGLIKARPEDLCGTLIEQGFWIERDLCIKILGETIRA
jgi:predicted nucleic acid-binding protein